METFHWDKNFETGLTDVDKQHHHLVDLVNQFQELLSEDKVSKGDIDSLFKELAEYTIYHFKTEETLMEQFSVDKRHVDDHVKIHNSFLDEVTSLYADVSRDTEGSAKHLLDFLTHWLAYHILGSDQNMSRQISAIESGATPESAYNKEEKQHDRATEALLIALNGLFEQVSSRNKELIKLNQSLEEKVAQRTKELSEANKHLEEISLTDVLTNLPNRRHAMRKLGTLWDESIEDSLPLVVMMIDADHFKEVNDTYGHDAGDEVLIELARTLKNAMRTDDVVCRLGGDEFFIICPNTDQEGGMYVAELMRKTVAELRVQTGGEPWHGSVSVGVASRTTEMKHYEELMKVADLGVYKAKEDGKNCVRTVS